MSDAPIPPDKQHKNLTEAQVSTLTLAYRETAGDNGWTVNFQEIAQGDGQWTLNVIYTRPGAATAPAAETPEVTAPAAPPPAPPTAAHPPAPPPQAAAPAAVSGSSGTVEAAFQALMALREGRRNDVYLDSRGLPTVGIGHLIVSADNLTVGEVISDARIDSFFQQDGAKALNAARSQAAAAGIASTAFIPFLASVNFQLGTKWTDTFPNTWKMIENGAYEAAARALDGTVWARQTPVRVQDFQKALRALPPKQ